MGKNKKVKLDRKHVERLLESVENRKEIAEIFVKQGFAEEWLIKNIELIGIYEDVLVNKVEEGIEKEELDFYEKVNREEFDLYEKYYFGEEYRFVRRRVEEQEYKPSLFCVVNNEGEVQKPDKDGKLRLKYELDKWTRR